MAPKKEEKKKSVLEDEKEEEVEEVSPSPPPPPSPSPGSGFYSVWAELPNVLGSIYDPTLHLIMTQLKEQHESPMFTPHVTIKGHQYSEFKDAENNLKALCASTFPFTLKVKTVGSGETYHQCLYLIMEKTDEVVDAHVQALKWFNQLKEDRNLNRNLEEIREKYMPHMSLMYCHMTDEELDLAKAKVEAEHGKELFGREYYITHLSLWLTDVDDESCLSWKRVAEFPLKEFEKPKWAQGQEKPPPAPEPEPGPVAEEGEGEKKEEGKKEEKKDKKIEENKK